MTSGEDFTITLSIPHRIRFTRNAFCPENSAVWDVLETRGQAKVLIFLEEAVAAAFPKLKSQIERSVTAAEGFHLAEVITLPGAELAKRDQSVLQAALDATERLKIDRHSYIFCVGGGAFLDVIGFAAATAHRGVRFVRFPTTTLAQDDSGVGVKNGINAYEKKNFLGVFSVPYAVINDFAFLETQDELQGRAGLIEAVKVALVKDAAFFRWIEENVDALRRFDMPVVEECVERSAILHAQHIALGGDPFENGNSRPLDYGHWSAHKLEQLTNFELSHAEAVAIGVGIDTLYARLEERLDAESCERVLRVIEALDLPLWHDALELRNPDGRRTVYDGLEEFREHLGGELTVLLLKETGKGEDVHTMDEAILEKAILELSLRCTAGV